MIPEINNAVAFSKDKSVEYHLGVDLDVRYVFIDIVSADGAKASVEIPVEIFDQLLNDLAGILE